ncbi:hypothetical protein JCM10213_004485 [Rhodosporidiobolus nylandii]
MSAQPIFYDLVGRHGGPLFAPNPLKARLALIHKGVDFDEVDLTFSELKAMAPIMGVERAFVPILKLPDGTFISDSWRIAEWLEETYPDKPSLFLPDLPTPYNPSAPELANAKNLARLLSEGFGSSDAMWTTFFELAAPSLVDLVQDEDKEYFCSDLRFGKDGWQRLMAADKDALMERAKASLLPVNALLQTSPFICGSHPGFADYVVYGRYHMMRAGSPALARQIWQAAHLPEVAAWVERLEKKWEKQLVSVLARQPAM